MQLIKRRGQTLIFEATPSILGLCLLVLVVVVAPVWSYVREGHIANGVWCVIGFALLFSTLFIEKTQLIFDQSSGKLNWRTWTVYKRKSGVCDLKDILTVSVEEQHGTKGTTYRCAVITKGDRIPLTSFYTAGRAHHQKIADQISQFLGQGGN